MRSPAKKLTFAFIGLVILLGLGWLVWPQVLVWSCRFIEPTDEIQNRAHCDRIVALGERAIPAIVEGIEKHTPWERGYAYLPTALREIGGSAYDDLVDSINRQEDITTKLALISAFQTAFDDFSYVEYLTSFDVGIERSSELARSHFEVNLRAAFPEAPTLFLETGEFNPRFQLFWLHRSSYERGWIDGPTLISSNQDLIELSDEEALAVWELSNAHRPRGRYKRLRYARVDLEKGLEAIEEGRLPEAVEYLSKAEEGLRDVLWLRDEHQFAVRALEGARKKLMETED